jgi:hypothetical protein
MVLRRDGLCFISMRRANCVQKESNGIKFGGTSYRGIVKREWIVFNVVKNLSFICAISRRM